MERNTRCRHCGEVIGVYEPMVVLSEGRVHTTSRIKLDGSLAVTGECYHDACYKQLQDEPSAD